MPIAGGTADKVGQRYETKWTVRAITELLEEQSEAIFLEPPNPSGEGVEFLVTPRKGSTQAHQVKRQRATGSWTLAALHAEGVLTAFLNHFRNGRESVFVSQTSAEELRELTDRSRAASDIGSFLTDFVGSELWRDQFSRLKKQWNTSDEESYRALRQITVRTQDERTLTEEVDARLSALVSGDAATARALIAQLTFESINTELKASRVWQYLEEKKFFRRSTAALNLAATAKRRAIGFIERARRLAVRGSFIPRAECATALKELRAGRDVVLVGGAGSGKSLVLAEVVENLVDAEEHVVIVRADQIAAMSTAAEYGRSIGFEESPAVVAGALSASRQTYLVIDQLDAVSAVSGRRAEQFEVVIQMLLQVAHYSNVRSVVACRAFDLQADHRFRSFLENPKLLRVPVGMLPPDAVQSVLKEAGLDSERADARLLTLLRTPVHLSMFMSVFDGGPIAGLDVGTPLRLYNEYWQQKRAAAGARVEGPDQWIPVLRQLTAAMDSRRALFAPATALDEFEAQMRAMSSEGVLVHEGALVSFFHETFFDYVYARLFSHDGKSCMDLLRSGPQDLFRRGQIRQILIHLREESRERYVTVLKELLFSTEIRLHIKATILDVLLAVEDPGPDEWGVAASLFDLQARLSSRVWGAIGNSRCWFERALGSGFLQRNAASSDPALARRATWALARAAEHSSNSACELVGALPHPIRREFLGAVAAPDGPAFAKLFCATIDEGGFDSFASELWRIAQSLCEKKHFDEGAQVLAAWFKRATGFVAAEDGSMKHMFRSAAEKSGGDGYYPAAVLQTQARERPGATLDAVLPFIGWRLQLKKDDREHQFDDGGVRDWQHRQIGRERSPSGPTSVLKAAQDALRKLSQLDARGVQRHLDFLSSLPFEAAKYLRAQVYIGNPSQFATEAVAWLSRDPQALDLGTLESRLSATWDVIAKCSGVCDVAAAQQLGAILLKHYPELDRGSSLGPHYSGQAQRNLLRAFSDERKTPTMKKRQAELDRKFGVWRTHPPEPSGGMVRSPIPAAAVDRMTNSQWVAAMSRYRGEHRKGFLEGGASQLSTELQRAAKDQPSRFAGLLCELPPGTDDHYIDGILRGIEGLDIPVELLLSACAHAQKHGGKYTNSFVADVLGKCPHLKVDEKVVHLLAACASDPDPDGRAQDEKKFEIDTAGINCVRGRTAGAIARLLSDNPERLEQLKPILLKLLDDKAIEVRAEAISALLQVLRTNPLFAIESTLSAATDDRILGSRHLSQFVAYARDPRVLELTNRMIESPDADVAATGARLLCLASYSDESLDARVDAVVARGTPFDRAAAEVFARNWADAPRRSRSLQMLGRFFANADAEVRSAAAIALHADGVAKAPGLDELLSNALRGEPELDVVSAAVELMAEGNVDLPGIALDACRAYVRRLGQSSNSPHRFERSINSLVLRIYAQATDRGTMDRCLDVIDALVETEAWGVDEALASVDR